MTEGPLLDRDALSYVLSLPQGRKLIWGLLGMAGLFRQPYVAGDAAATAFSCGSLNIGLALYADCLQASPTLTAMMTKEQADDDRHSLNRKRRDDADSDKRVPGPDDRDSGSAGSDPFFDRLGFGRGGEPSGD